METKYEDSLFYQINTSSKVFEALFNQFFKELDMGVSALEHLSLCIISQTQDCCQRDLAKLIFKDRANTGKLAGSLEKKGFIKIELKTKNNRPVKILTITQQGVQLLNETRKIIVPLIDKVKSRISAKVMEETKNNLKNFREIVEEAIKTKI